MTVLTAEKVIDAAEALAAKGERVTQNSVREALGGGSYSTISATLRKWKQEQKEIEEANSKAAAMPDYLLNRFEVWRDEIWRVASSVADEGLANERAKFEHYKAEYIEKGKEDAIAIRTLELEAETLKNDLAEVEENAAKRIKQVEDKSVEIRLEVSAEIADLKAKEAAAQEAVIKADKRADAAVAISEKIELRVQQLIADQLEAFKRAENQYSQLAERYQSSKMELEKKYAAAQQDIIKAEKRAVIAEERLDELIKKMDK